MATDVSPLNFASFSIAAILMCITCGVYMILQHRYDKAQSKVFIAIIVDVAITAFASLVTEMGNPSIPDDAFATACVRIANFFYFPAHMALAPLFCIYVLLVRDGSTRWQSSNVRLGFVLFAIMELITLTNPFTGWVYYYGPGVVYTRNWALAILYVGSLLFMAVGLYILMAHYSAMTVRKRRALVYFFFMVAVGVAVQLLMPTVRVELFCESIAVVGVMLFVEDEAELIDTEAGVYNRHALKADLARFSAAGHPYYVITVEASDIETFSLLGKSDFEARLMLMAAEYFKTVMPWYYVYRAAPKRFVLMNPAYDEAEALQIAERVAGRFEESWELDEIDFKLNTSVILACVPDDLRAVEDVMYMIDTPAPTVQGKSVLKGDDLNYLMRRADVERAVRRGFEQGCYEVYYQPVYGADGKVSSAEALMRLHDEMLGNVPPDEFIGAAERIGYIERIGDFALEQVCAFLASGVPERLGITKINVNLSVVQCMQVDFATHVEEVIGRYDINPDLITFEITESVAAGSYDTLHDLMDVLKAYGHQFAMDDYGTGYSNMHSLLALDFDVVKVDKSVLWDAEKNQAGMTILENSMQMLHNMGSTVLVEGVETAEQVALLRQLGANYFQGFYFARPMPVDVLVEELGA